MKSYTNISQSKKLTEILPVESADMARFTGKNRDVYSRDNVIITNYILAKKEFSICGEIPIEPCWSLAALIDNIPQVKLDNIKQYDKKYWRCCAYFASDWHNSDWCDNPVDACYEMIIKLHEQKFL